MERRRLPGVAALLLFALPATAGDLRARDLECSRQPAPRAVEICRALEGALKWSWTGHATISPGYRIDTDRVAALYCTLPIRPDDTATLVHMAVAADDERDFMELQLHSGAEELLNLLGQAALDRFPEETEFPATGGARNRADHLKRTIALTIRADSTSIFNPSHPLYILREGCPAGKRSGRP